MMLNHVLLTQPSQGCGYQVEAQVLARYVDAEKYVKATQQLLKKPSTHYSFEFLFQGF